MPAPTTTTWRLWVPCEAEEEDEARAATGEEEEDGARRVEEVGAAAFADDVAIALLGSSPLFCPLSSFAWSSIFHETWGRLSKA
jgi:hypothetical protein